jgi:hypothetical protein
MPPSFLGSGVLNRWFADVQPVSFCFVGKPAGSDPIYLVIRELGATVLFAFRAVFLVISITRYIGVIAKVSKVLDSIIRSILIDMIDNEAIRPRPNKGLGYQSVDMRRTSAG